MLFTLFVIRAGIQILANHPRLYWKRYSTPGTDWFRFQVPVPKGRVWTSKDDSVSIPGWPAYHGKSTKMSRAGISEDGRLPTVRYTAAMGRKRMVG